MKRSNKKTKKGEHKPLIQCRWCGHELQSKYDAKSHVCRSAGA